MVYKYNIPDDHPGDEVKVKDVWKGFREDTTAHGIPHVSNAPGNRFVSVTRFTSYHK